MVATNVNTHALKKFNFEIIETGLYSAQFYFFDL